MTRGSPVRARSTWVWLAVTVAAAAALTARSGELAHPTRSTPLPAASLDAAPAVAGHPGDVHPQTLGRPCRHQRPGALSEPCLAALRALFSLFDTDGDGTIGIGELGTLLRTVGLNLTEAELQQLFALADADGSGAVDFSEFIEVLSRRR